MGVQYLEISTLEQTGATASFLTAAENALTDRTDLLAWFDARGWSAEMDTSSRISTWYSRKPVGVSFPTVSTSSAAQGLYWGIVPGGTERDEIRFGINAAGAAIAGFNNKLATGNSHFVVPATDFTIELYMRVLTPASTTVILGTSDTTAPMSINVTSTGVIRWYSAYSTTFIATSSGVVADQNYHKFVFNYDATAKTGAILYDGSTVKSASSLDLSSHVGQVMQFGQIVSGGSTTTAGSGFALQGALLISDVAGTTTRGLYDTVLTERAA